VEKPDVPDVPDVPEVEENELKYPFDASGGLIKK
jgi:hypothetical protein